MQSVDGQISLTHQYTLVGTRKLLASSIPQPLHASYTYIFVYMRPTYSCLQTCSYNLLISTTTTPLPLFWGSIDAMAEYGCHNVMTLVYLDMGGRRLDREIVTVASHCIVQYRIISSMLVCIDAHTPRIGTVRSGSSVKRRQGQHRHHLSGIMGTRESGFSRTVPYSTV